MASGTPDEIAAKWAQRLSGATADIQRGIDRVQVAPGALAARSADAWQARVIAARQKWERNVSRVSLAEWQQAAKEKGAPRVATGAQAAQPKMAQFMGELIPHIERGRGRIRSMPKVTIQDSRARMNAWMDHMVTFRRGGGGL